MEYLIIILFSYLLGTSSMSYYIAKFKGIDLRQHGSGNLGASNALGLMGKKVGVIVAIHDIGKAMLAVGLASTFFPNLMYVEEIAGVSCILGHIFPFYLNFRGGKGFACYLGMTLMIDFKFFILLLVIIVVVALVTDYIVSGTLTTMLLVPLYLGYVHHDLYITLILMIASIVMLFKHKENIKRMANGTENGIRNALLGKYRIK